MVLQKLKDFFSRSLWREVVAGLIVIAIVSAIAYLWHYDKKPNSSSPTKSPVSELHPEISITNHPPLKFVPNQMEDIAGEVRGLGLAYTDYAVVIYIPIRRILPANLRGPYNQLLIAH